MRRLVNRRLSARRFCQAVIVQATLVLCAAHDATGTSISNGEALYNTICSNCHGPAAADNVYGIMAGANNPGLIQSLINTNVGGMGILSSLYHLSSSQISDAASYLGSVFYPSQGAPGIASNPPSLVFSPQTLGSSAAAITVILSNTGTGTLIITGITTSSSDYGVFSGCGVNLAPGANCFVTVTFAPKSIGTILGSLTIQSNASPANFAIPLTGAGTSVALPTGLPQVVEFYNSVLDTYFITADASEASAIDGGSAGLGWSRTGNSFKSGGNAPVCRFYGSMSPGPNSHFYTVDAGECAYLRQLQASTPDNQQRWNFESIDFVSTAPTNSTCPGGTTSVYRAYNNGSNRGIDSNHRITTNLTAIQQVVARGWTNEGVVMCAPP